MGIGWALFLHVGFLDVDDDAAVGTAADRYCKMKDIRGGGSATGHHAS